jgi:hypothetical protein
VRIQGPVGPSNQSGGDDTWRTGAEHLSDFGNQVKAVFDSLSAEAQIVRPLAPPMFLAGVFEAHVFRRTRPMADEYVARLSAKSFWCHTCFAGLGNIYSKFMV